MKKVIYPGSFDPITNGHIDIIKRAANLFDKVYICVAKNIHKQSFFTIEQRKEMVEEATKDIKNVEVIVSNELIVNVAKKLSCSAIVRGLRAVTDFEYEFSLAAGNEFLDKSIEMVFLMATPEKSFISSSSIKEFFYHDVDISRLVPKCVIEMFKIREKELELKKDK